MLILSTLRRQACGQSEVPDGTGPISSRLSHIAEELRGKRRRPAMSGPDTLTDLLILVAVIVVIGLGWWWTARR